MGRITEDDRKTLWETIAAALFLLVFLAVAALSLWPSGNAILALRLGKGYVLFWVVLALVSWAVNLLLRFFRVESDPPSSPYVFTNIFVSAFLQAGWSAFGALTVHSLLSGASTGLAIGLHAAGLVSSLVAAVMVGVFYQGTLYKFVNGPLAVISYIVFALWSFAGRAIYGWFFALFGAG